MSDDNERAALLQLHDWDELIFGGFYCLHCTPDDEDSLDDPIAWPCPPLREAGVTDDEARALILAHREKIAAECKAKKDAEKAELQRRADDFNACYPVGSPVIAYPGARPENDRDVTRLVTRTRSQASVLGGHTAVVWVDGHSACIALSHVDIASRTNTPDQTAVNKEGRTVTSIKMKRACNGCGQSLGDVDNRDVDANGNLTDVRHECPFCGPVVELERQGWRTWFLTPRSFNRIDDEIDRMGVFAKGYWENVDGKLTVTGLRIGGDGRRVVAHYGDWIAHHPRIGWTVHKAVS